jgi:hypothetical protein
MLNEKEWECLVTYFLGMTSRNTELVASPGLSGHSIARERGLLVAGQR